MPSFDFNAHFSYNEYAAALRKQITENNGKNDILIGDLLQRNPVIVNHYNRRYFLTGDGKYRITLDNEMWFYNYQSALYGRHTFGTKDPHIIVEVKFAPEDFAGAIRLINDLGYRIYKNSKYINGINAVYFNSSLLHV